jgi:hypothetical protein
MSFYKNVYQLTCRCFEAPTKALIRELQIGEPDSPGLYYPLMEVMQIVNIPPAGIYFGLGWDGQEFFMVDMKEGDKVCLYFYKLTATEAKNLPAALSEAVKKLKCIKS